MTLAGPQHKTIASRNGPPQPSRITVDREEYAWSFSESKGILWTSVRTKNAPSAELVGKLNRHVIQERAEEELNAWGKHYLPEYVAWLTALKVTNDDFQRLGLGFLVQSDTAKRGRRRSPLNVLGYRVGKSGLAENARREILRKAVTEELPNVGTAEYMAKWGLSNSPRRVMAITLHLVRHLTQGRKPDADYSEATAAWEADIAWLKEEFYDLSTPPLVTPTGWWADLVSSQAFQ